MVDIYIVRHCEARGNIDRIFHGRYDSDISENGRLQLERLSERFKDIPLDAVYSSPLKRTRLTADAVNLHHGLPVVIRDELIEINGGYMENRPWSDMPKVNPEDARRWNLEPHLFAAEGGEAMADVYKRISAAVLAIAAENGGKTVAVATHGCAIRNLICWAEGRPIEQLYEVDWCDNTGVSLLRFDDELRPQVVFKNDVSHLSEDAMTLKKQNWWKPENLKKLKFD